MVNGIDPLPPFPTISLTDKTLYMNDVTIFVHSLFLKNRFVVSLNFIVKVQNPLKVTNKPKIKQIVVGTRMCFQETQLF